MMVLSLITCFFISPFISRSEYLGRTTSTVKLVLEGVLGPGRKLSKCCMLKEEMETLEGAGRETHTTAGGVG